LRPSRPAGWDLIAAFYAAKGDTTALEKLLGSEILGKEYELIGALTPPPAMPNSWKNSLTKPLATRKPRLVLPRRAEDRSGKPPIPPALRPAPGVPSL